MQRFMQLFKTPKETLIVNMLPGGLEVDNNSLELVVFGFSSFVGAILVEVVLTATEEFSATLTEKNRIKNL